MLKVLVKKQFTEVFRNYFYNAKKNKMRSDKEIAGYIAFFLVIMVGFLGGTFTTMAFSFLGVLNRMGQEWFYFLVMSGIAITLGAFGSVFNTYSSLYLASDNDLLLSLPIPAGTIMTARLINVYLLGTMYASTVLIPMLGVYWAVTGFTFSKLICGILLYLINTMIILILSCLLGWIIAKISVRLKNNSYLKVLISLVFIGAYYYFYFKANSLGSAMLENAGNYSENLKGSAALLYHYGMIGTGEWLSTGLYTAAAAILFGIMFAIMQRSFLNIAASGGKAEKKQYTEKTVKQKSVFMALLGKELSRFTSSATYMMNSGLPLFLLPVAGIYILLKGREIFQVLDMVFAEIPNSTTVILCTSFCTLAGMIFIAVPSISLEGKNIWILQSLPVSPKLVLRAKAGLQMILTMVPLLFSLICASFIIQASPAAKILLFLLPSAFTFFASAAGTIVGVRMPMMNWTSETSVIKQSGAVLVVMFGGMIINTIFAGLFFLIGYQIGAVSYLLIWTILYTVIGLLLFRWLDTKGAAMFAAL